MATLATLAPPLARSSRSLPDILGKEIRYEFLGLLRTRAFSLSVLGFPVMFYLLFGVMQHGRMEGQVAIAKYMLGGYAVFGLAGAALFGIGVGLASQREAGWLELKRASPMPSLAFLLAKCVSAIAFGLIIVTILSVLGITLGGVHLTAREFASMLALTVVGVLPFAAMGLLIALLAPANSATGVVNLLYLPMSFVSGLWIPLNDLPHWLRGIAPLVPTYHLSQLMLGIFEYQNASSAVSHWFGLLGFTMLMLGCAWAVFQRAEQNA